MGVAVHAVSPAVGDGPQGGRCANTVLIQNVKYNTQKNKLFFIRRQVYYLI